MKTRLRIFTAILFLIAAMFCIAVLANTGGTDGNIRWSLNDAGTLTISGTGDMLPYHREDRGAPQGIASFMAPSFSFRVQVLLRVIL